MKPWSKTSVPSATPSLKKEYLQKLIYLLQNAYSGELAAFYAYDGHQKSVSDLKEKSEIKKIRDEEWAHRQCVGKILTNLGATSRPSREWMMKCVGLTIGGLCRIGGWLIPMYGAGKLESGNIAEYEVAARLAYQAGFPEYVEPLLEMAEIEWDHELYFRVKYQSHPLHFIMPRWPVPASRERIRIDFAQFTSQFELVEGVVPVH